MDSPEPHPLVFHAQNEVLEFIELTPRLFSHVIEGGQALALRVPENRFPGPFAGGRTLRSGKIVVDQRFRDIRQLGLGEVLDQIENGGQ